MKTKREILSLIEKSTQEISLAAWNEFDLKELKNNYEDLNLTMRQLSDMYERRQNKEGQSAGDELLRELKVFKQFIIDNYLAGTKVKIYS